MERKASMKVIYKHLLWSTNAEHHDQKTGSAKKHFLPDSLAWRKTWCYHEGEIMDVYRIPYVARNGCMHTRTYDRKEGIAFSSGKQQKFQQPFSVWSRCVSSAGVVKESFSHWHIMTTSTWMVCVRVCKETQKAHFTTYERTTYLSWINSLCNVHDYKSGWKKNSIHLIPFKYDDW